MLLMNLKCFSQEGQYENKLTKGFLTAYDFLF